MSAAGPATGQRERVPGERVLRDELRGVEALRGRRAVCRRGAEEDAPGGGPGGRGARHALRGGGQRVGQRVGQRILIGQRSNFTLWTSDRNITESGSQSGHEHCINRGQDLLICLYQVIQRVLGVHTLNNRSHGLLDCRSALVELTHGLFVNFPFSRSRLQCRYEKRWALLPCVP